MNFKFQLVLYVCVINIINYLLKLVCCVVRVLCMTDCCRTVNRTLTFFPWTQANVTYLIRHSCRSSPALLTCRAENRFIQSIFVDFGVCEFLLFLSQAYFLLHQQFCQLYIIQMRYVHCFLKHLQAIL